MLKKVLIVDDSFAVRFALRSWLQDSADWRVCGEAENGKAAIEAAQRFHPDIVILDLSMPVMNGLDAASVLSTQFPRPAIILFTAQEVKDLLGHVGDLGIIAVISKADEHVLEHLQDSLVEASDQGRMAA
jgi:DNA-binding NarL/FixJ family response regulator